MTKMRRISKKLVRKKENLEKELDTGFNLQRFILSRQENYRV